MMERIAEASPRRWARIAGGLYLTVIVGGIFAVGFVPAAIVVPGDAAATAHNILGNELLYRLGLVAHIIILAFNMPGVQGRVLEEALKGGPHVTAYTVLGKIYRSSKKTGLKVKLPTDLDGRTIDPNRTTYSVELRTKILTRGGTSYMYFDQARAIRE